MKAATWTCRRRGDNLMARRPALRGEEAVRASGIPRTRCGEGDARLGGGTGAGGGISRDAGGHDAGDGSGAGDVRPVRVRAVRAVFGYADAGRDLFEAEV